MTDWLKIRDEQIRHLRELQELNNREILVQNQSDVKEPWITLETFKSSGGTAIRLRSALYNELIFEVDNENWNEMYAQTKKVYDWLTERKAPVYIVYTGGKSLHLRVYMNVGTIETDRETMKMLEEYGIDLWRALRVFFYDKVKRETGAEMDKQMFSWGSDTKGRMERTEGSIHESGSFCSYLSSIPEKKPAEYELQFMPKPTLWDISTFTEEINAYLRELISTARREDPEQDLSLSGIDYAGVPCLKNFLEKGTKLGQRHSGLYSVASLCRELRLPIEQAKETARKYLQACEDQGSIKWNADIKNVEDIYAGKKRFSCYTLRDIFGEYCDKRKCSIYAKRTEALRREEGSDKDQKGKDKQDKEIVYHCSHLVEKGKLYLEVFTSQREYRFAYLNDEGRIVVIESINYPDYRIEPVKLPVREGNPLKVVQIPDEGIVDAPLLPAKQLKEEIRAHQIRYTDMNDLDQDLATYYTLFTWVYEKVNTKPDFRLLADTGKGKSRIEKVTSDLCFYPLSVKGSGTISGAMREEERWRGTMVLDEADFKGVKLEMWEKYINLGFEKGQYFCMSDKKNPRLREWFDPYCPKIIAMKQPFEDPATEGRLLSISPSETTNEDIPVNLPDDYEKEAAALRDKIAKFFMAHWSEIDERKLIDFKGLGLEPRLRQQAMPLSIIFQLWPEGEEEFRDYLKERQKEVKRIRAQTWEGSLFNYVYSLATGDEDLAKEFAEVYLDKDTKKVKAVTPKMVAGAFRTTSKNATQTLASIGFVVEGDHIDYSKKVREGEHGAEYEEKRVTIRKYAIPSQKKWNEAVQRYYFNEDEADDPEIPEILKSKNYVSCAIRSAPSAPSAPKNESESGSGQKSGTDGTNGTDAITHHEQDFVEIEALEDLPEFVDYSGKDWKDGIKKGSILSMESRTAKLLIEKGRARLLDNVQSKDLLDRQAREAVDRMREWGLKDNEEKDGICEWCGERGMVRLIKGSYTCRECAPDVLKDGA